MPGGPISVSYGYDSVGNCVSEGSERKYEWDHAGRLRSFRNQAADTSEPTQYVQYLYDAAGQRVKKLNRKQTGANWDAVVYIDGVLELRTQKRGATTKQGLELHVLDGQKRLGRRRSSDSFDSKPDNLLVLGDHLGSANVELDWSLGSFVDREEFRPYGETSFGSYANKRYRFTGKERDEESGLNYHGARYYAPGLARWMSPDPKGLVDGSNLFAYTRGNPLRYSDPHGTNAVSTDQRGNSSPTLTDLSTKVITGTATPGEIRQWKDQLSQRHRPESHPSIGQANPDAISEKSKAHYARNYLQTQGTMTQGVLAAGYAYLAQSVGHPIELQCQAAGLGAGFSDMASTHFALMPGVVNRAELRIKTEFTGKVVPKDGIIKVGGDHRNEAGRGTSLNPGWSDKYGGLPVWAILENQPERFEYLGHIFRNESALQVVSSALPVKGLLTPPGSWEIERGAAGAFSVLKPGGIVRMNFWIDMNNLPLVQRVITAFRVVGFEDVRFLSSNAGSVL
jgi:RHS repeat-associated protein